MYNLYQTVTTVQVDMVQFLHIRYQTCIYLDFICFIVIYPAFVIIPMKFTLGTIQTRKRLDHGLGVCMSLCPHM